MDAGREQDCHLLVRLCRHHDVETTVLVDVGERGVLGPVQGSVRDLRRRQLDGPAGPLVLDGKGAVGVQRQRHLVALLVATHRVEPSVRVDVREVDAVGAAEVRGTGGAGDDGVPVPGWVHEGRAAARVTGGAGRHGHQQGRDCAQRRRDRAEAHG